MKKTLLKAEHICCGYGGDPVVKDISFQVEEGESLCILGPNGCGKTTLLRGLAGILPVEGEVSVEGQSLAGMSARQRGRRIALMSQLSETYFAYTVYETVMLGRYVHRKRGLFAGKNPEDESIVEESLRKVGMLPLADRLITELSGGQLQRVYLARTFAQDPQVILLDEPTNHLDLKYQVELAEHLKEWAGRGNRCLVGVFHDINLALSFADRVLLMDEGRIAALEQAEHFKPELLNEVYGLDVGAYMRSALKRWEEGDKNEPLSKPV